MWQGDHVPHELVHSSRCTYYTQEKRISHTTKFLVPHTGVSRRDDSCGKEHGESKVGRRGCILGRLFVSRTYGNSRQCFFPWRWSPAECDQAAALRIRRIQEHEHIVTSPLICPWEVLSHWSTMSFLYLEDQLWKEYIYSQEERESITLKEKQVLSLLDPHTIWKLILLRESMCQEQTSGVFFDGAQ